MPNSKKIPVPQTTRKTIYRLDCFEGPLDLLFHLVEQRELEIFDLALHHISKQLVDNIDRETIFLDEQAEGMWLLSFLTYLKSQRLLPNSALDNPQELVEHTSLMLMNHIIEYQRYKQAALHLASLEEKQASLFSRNPAPSTSKENKGLEHVLLSELTDLLSKIIHKVQAPHSISLIKEKWDISTKISWLEEKISQEAKILCLDLFSPKQCQEELIVLFLALLELVKRGIVSLIKEKETLFVIRRNNVSY